MRRPERYLDEIYGECSCSEDEDEGSERNAERRALARDAESVRWPVEDLRERDAAWVTSCLWVQCKFKSRDGLGRTMAEDVAELRRGVRVGTPPRLGPTARMLWCKLKWEEGAGKTAGSREEAEIEREILALFDDAAAANVLNDENMSEELNAAWRDALRNLGWLYASQILAAQREDEDAAHAWLDKREDLLDEQIIVLTRSWIQKANINKNYRFSVSYDEHTGRVMVKNQRVDDDGEDENASRRRRAGGRERNGNHKILADGGTGTSRGRRYERGESFDRRRARVARHARRSRNRERSYRRLQPAGVRHRRRLRLRRLQPRPARQRLAKPREKVDQMTRTSR